MGLRRSESRKAERLERETDRGIETMELPDLSVLPEEAALSSDLMDAVNRAAESLSEPLRIVFLLRDVEGFSNEETAEILGISVAAVKSRLHRARAAVRAELEHYLAS